MILAGICFIAPLALAAWPSYASTGVVISRQCSVSSSVVSVGSSLTATGTLQNTGTSSVTLPAVVLAGRPPRGTNSGGPYDDFSPHDSNVTIAAGATVTLTASRSFTSSDRIGAWRCYLTFETSDGVYHDGQNAYFTVTNGSALPVSFTYSPSTPVTGQSVSFDGTATICMATPCSYTWTDDADNSHLGTGVTMTFTFQQVGTKYVRLSVTDGGGQAGSVELDVVVGSPTSPMPSPTSTPSLAPSPSPTPVSAPIPTVSFSYAPSNPVTGQPVSFDGASTICMATPCSYSWTDDADGSHLGTGVTMTFTFVDVGTKYVRLTVTDALGQTAGVEHNAVVSAPITPSPSPTPSP